MENAPLVSKNTPPAPKKRSRSRSRSPHRRDETVKRLKQDDGECDKSDLKKKQVVSTTDTMDQHAIVLGQLRKALDDLPSQTDEAKQARSRLAFAIDAYIDYLDKRTDAQIKSITKKAQETLQATQQAVQHIDAARNAARAHIDSLVAKADSNRLSNFDKADIKAIERLSNKPWMKTLLGLAL